MPELGREKIGGGIDPLTGNFIDQPTVEEPKQQPALRPPLGRDEMEIEVNGKQIRLGALARSLDGAEAGPGKEYAESLRSIISKEGYVNHGSERTLFLENGPDSDQLVGIFPQKRKAAELKYAYYTVKLLRLMMPNNFPDMHLATSNPSTTKTDLLKEPTGALRSKWLEMMRERRIVALEKKLDRLAVWVDPYRDNFMYNEKGNINYVDRPIVKDPAVFRQQVTKRLKGEKLRKALLYLDRIDELGKALDDKFKQRHRITGA